MNNSASSRFHRRLEVFVSVKVIKSFVGRVEHIFEDKSRSVTLIDEDDKEEYDAYMKSVGPELEEGDEFRAQLIQRDNNGPYEMHIVKIESNKVSPERIQEILKECDDLQWDF